MPRATNKARPGKKLYAKRSKVGVYRFQSCARAHGSDVKRKSAAEKKSAKTKGTKKRAAKKK